MINEISNLFREDLVFIEEAESSEDILSKVGKKLIKRGLVRNNFVEEIIKREEEYPTGIDLNVVYSNHNIPNVAIPHTETEYCNTKNVIVVKSKNNIKFKNMISPEKELNVRFLFMILNNAKDSQTNILANIMGFITQIKNIEKLCNAADEKEIYNVISG
ncbi:PTS sugar transporter subunit IIA [Clostridium sp. Marseille-Q2269]|uniref:PTS sugar transporter subunit IIA n=1 Tax=Clostridium sp. Marseille-Q2269 TaxID=2942205 RepID=UPI0020735B25|nr:PTS sugar transporter subunit IIA [Clostridium sp. Marseille-Q2269]